MKNNRRWAGTSFVPSILLLALLTSPGCGPGDRPDIFALATAGTGGVYYLLGGSMAELLSRELSGYDFVAEVTGGSVENLNLLLAGDVQIAFSMGTNAHEVFYGTGSFSERSPQQVLVIRADMSEELVYNLVRALLGVRTELGAAHPAARRMSEEYTLETSPIPLHPGAVRYFEESGYEVPDRLIAPQ